MSLLRDLRKLGMNLVPFPRVRFLQPLLPSWTNRNLYSCTSWCPAMHLSTTRRRSTSRIILWPSWLKRMSSPFFYVFIFRIYISLLQFIRPQKLARRLWSSFWVCHAIQLLNFIPTLTFSTSTLSRYLTAATIFRGNISSREVSVSDYAQMRTWWHSLCFAQAEVCTLFFAGSCSVESGAQHWPSL